MNTVVSGVPSPSYDIPTTKETKQNKSLTDSAHNLLDNDIEKIVCDEPAVKQAIAEFESQKEAQKEVDSLREMLNTHHIIRYAKFRNYKDLDKKYIDKLKPTKKILRLAQAGSIGAGALGILNGIRTTMTFGEFGLCLVAASFVPFYLLPALYDTYIRWKKDRLMEKDIEKFADTTAKGLKEAENKLNMELKNARIRTISRLKETNNSNNDENTPKIVDETGNDFIIVGGVRLSKKMNNISVSFIGFKQ